MPTTDAGVGHLLDPYEGGACRWQDNFNYTRTVDGGLDMSVGFHAMMANVHFQHEGYSDIGNGM